MELFSIPHYYIKKWRPHGHRYGKKPGDYEYFIANSFKEKCKKFFLGILDRFIRDEKFHKKMFDVGRSEELCFQVDKLANEDHKHHITPEEICVYSNNWWIRSNTVGSDTMPVRHWAEAHQQRWKSYSSSWWKWQESWWHSFYEHQHEDGPSTNWSGKPFEKWMECLFEVWFSEVLCCIITVQNSVTANSSLPTPTGGVNTILPYIKILRKLATMKTIATVYSYENTNAMNCSITIQKNWNDAHNNKQLTMQNKYTTDDVDFDCVAHNMHWVCVYRALFTVSVDETHRTLMAQVAFTFPSTVILMARSLWLDFSLLPLPYLPALLRLLLLSRAVPWARQPDRGEREDPELLHLSHTCCGRTIWPIVWDSKFVDEDTYTFDQWSCERRSISKVPITSGEQNRMNKFLLMRNSWQHCWRRTVLYDQDCEEFSQVTESVACREHSLPRDEKSSDPKGWIRGNTKLGPYWKSQPATF